jgi:hypothetical protein
MTDDRNNPVSLNSHPLNQSAAVHLRALGQEPDPDSLYSLQLVQHLLENDPEGLPYPANNRRQELLTLVQAAQQGDPSQNQSLLLNQATGDNPEDAAAGLARRLRSLSPRQAASLLAENFHANLSEKNPGMLGVPLTES